MTRDDSADAIRRRMAELRRELTCDVRDVGRSARAMADPSFYVRRFPWATVAVAAAIGYMLIPKKKQIVRPDPELLAEMVRKNQVKVDTSKASKDSQGLVGSLLVMGLSWAARTGMNYMVQRLTTPAREGQRKSGEEYPPAPSPLEEPWKTTR
jgi:hypothetical protein